MSCPGLRNSVDDITVKFHSSILSHINWDVHLKKVVSHTYISGVPTKELIEEGTRHLFQKTSTFSNVHSVKTFGMFQFQWRLFEGLNCFELLLHQYIRCFVYINLLVVGWFHLSSYERKQNWKGFSQKKGRRISHNLLDNDSQCTVHVHVCSALPPLMSIFLKKDWPSLTAIITGRHVFYFEHQSNGPKNGNGNDYCFSIWILSS
jgi:hypothetical protein